MIVLIPIIMMILISSTSCVTPSSSKLPPCDPNKVYIQPVPPACEPVKKKQQEYQCPKTKRMGTPYTEIDEANFNIAKKRCPELYPSSPCLKVFAKTEAYTYTAICGAASSGGGEKVVNWKDRTR